jgi:hypothetical protein
LISKGEFFRASEIWLITFQVVINAHLRQRGFYAKFPPPGIEVISWYVMMGIGQVVTLRVPAERLREGNRVLEETAWGGYRTEFYPTYDYKAIAEEQRKPGQ